MKKIIATVLVLLMIVPFAVFGGSADTITADTSWYDASKSEYVITTAAQLLGIARVGGNYSGKTIKLDADITLNEGDAASWEVNAPAIAWNPINNFAGTFDGQGHTVSGLYYTAAGSAAMFTGTNENCLIKDFRLVNSFFATKSGVAAAGVSCNGGGTFERIYCNAIIVCADHHAGGIFGVCNKPTTARECWFDGQVTIGMRYAAGIIGNGNNQPVVIEHCLNTGDIYTRQELAANSHIGGICGRNDNSTTIVDCLNTGLIHSAYAEAGNTDVYGSVFGCCSGNKKNDDGSWISKVNIYNSWGTAESCLSAVGNNASKDPEQVNEAHSIAYNLLIGYGAYFNTDLDFNNYWAVNIDGAPILMYFAEVVPKLYDVAMPSISDMEIKAEGHWGPRWTVSLDLPEGYTKEDVTLGAVVVPTKALPTDEFLIAIGVEGLEYRGNEYPVANIEGKITRESDENSVVATFVVTDLSEKTIRSNLTIRPYATYKVPEGELTMYGAPTSATFYTEAKLTEDEELKAQLDVALADVDAAIGEGFTVSRDWSTRGIFEEIPALVVDDTRILPEEDKGLGEYTITVDGTEENLDDYVALLETCGFTKVVDNGEDGLKGAVFTVNLVKDDLMVCVTDVSYQNKIFISAIYDQPLSDHLFDKDEWRADMIPGAVTTLSQVELYWWGDSYVIQMKNGHFIVIDGATNYELGYLLDYLESLTPGDEKPVIEAWCNTHMHMDHFYILNQFNTNPEWIDRVYVEGFYFNEPSDAVKDTDPGVYNEISREYIAMNKLKTTDGGVPGKYRPQMGQRYYFCDITMEIMLAQEQIPLKTYTGGFNDSSTFYLFTMDGQTFLEGGDGHRACMKFIMDSYEREDLQVDFFSVLHHGANTWETFTDWVGHFKTVLFPTAQYQINGQLGAARNQDLVAHCDEYFYAGSGTDVFYLPYTVGKSGTDGGRVELPTYSEHREV